MAQATDTGLPVGTTDDVLEMLVDDMLQKAHTKGANPELDKKVEDALSVRNGGIFFPRRSVQGAALLGYPGHGKTTAFKMAAQKVADLIDLNLKINPPNEETITSNDFVLISRELSGEVHNGAIVGLPGIEIFQTESGEDQKYMTQYANKRLASCRHAGASVLLLDDALNASPNIQNICLSLAEEGRYDSLNLGKTTYVGLTGNLGSLDGTYTTNMSSALRTRLKLFQVEDTVENWVDRSHKEFDLDVADGGIAGFLQENPELFHAPEPRGKGSYPAPRTWSKLAPVTEEQAYLVSRGAKSSGAALEAVSKAAQGAVGRNAATRLHSYLHSLYTMASPLAREAVENKGQLSDKSLEIFKEKIGSGHSQPAQEFGHQYVTSVAEIGAHRAAKAKQEHGESSDEHLAAVKDVFRDVSHALLDYDELDNDKVSRGFGHFLLRLTNADPDIVTNQTGRPHMNQPYLTALGEAAAECKRSAQTMPDGETFYVSVLIPQLSGKLFTDSDLIGDVDVDLENDKGMEQ